jgi:hypothetical protein
MSQGIGPISKVRLHHADAHAPVYAIDECVFKEDRNHAAAIALHTMYYNFVRIHQTLKVTPAMAAGVSDKLWEVSDIVEIWSSGS